jgi:hypothetical protein
MKLSHWIRYNNLLTNWNICTDQHSHYVGQRMRR